MSETPEVITGINAVREALEGGLSIEYIMIAQEQQNPRLREVRTLAAKSGVQVRLQPMSQLRSAAGAEAGQGVVAFLAQVPYVSVDRMLELAGERDEPPLLVLLDGIEDPHNLGAILRSAEGAGFHGVILPKRRSASVNATVLRTSAGAAAHIPIARVSNLAYAMEELKTKGVWLAGADQDAEKFHTETDLSGPLGLVIGAEGKGLHRLVREKSDFTVRIPMFGKMNSLNASVAAAVLMFEVRRQRSASSG